MTAILILLCVESNLLSQQGPPSGSKFAGSQFAGSNQTGTIHSIDHAKGTISLTTQSMFSRPGSVPAQTTSTCRVTTKTELVMRGQKGKWKDFQEGQVVKFKLARNSREITWLSTGDTVESDTHLKPWLLEVGQEGEFLEQDALFFFEAVQVIGPTEAIVQGVVMQGRMVRGEQVGPFNKRTVSPTFWLSGVPTDKWADGRKIALTGLFSVSGTKAYATTEGGKRTVLLVEAKKKTK